MIKVKRNKTYKDVYEEFLRVTGIANDDTVIDDWRPCAPPYYESYIQNAIIIWLKNGAVYENGICRKPGAQIIYISDSDTIEVG